jgi:hypothetical protein
MTTNIGCVLFAIACLALTSCSGPDAGSPLSSAYPTAVDPAKVGSYDALAKSGGGYFYDEVLEYRVWVHPGGDDYFQAFATFEEAEAFSKKQQGAEPPLVLVLQHEHVNEPSPGVFEHVKGDRIAEWQVEWLKGGKRGPDSIEKFLKEKQNEAAKPPAERQK